MSFKHRQHVYNLYIFIFLIITTNLISVQGLTRSRFDLPERFDIKLADDVFESLISTYKPVEFSKGIPNMLPPTFMLDALENVTRSLNQSLHQYTPPGGLIEFRTEIAGLYSPLLNRTLVPTKNVMVSLGSMEALYLTLLVHTLPGEEWIVIEPAFERYYAMIKMAGGVVRPIRLKSKTSGGELSSGDMVLDKNELINAFNRRTKGIIVNNPQNPTGKIYTKEELMFIAKLAEKWNTLIISDEVYEWLIYDSNKYIRMASLGEQTFNRTITVSSLSKNYFATGWRLGWAIGSPKLIGNLIAQQPYVAISLTTYAQLAAAKSLRKMRDELGQPNSYFNQLAKSMEQRRNFAVELVKKIGMEPIIPQSSYYVFANWTRLESRAIGLDSEEGSTRDVKFVKWLIKNANVTASLGTAHYSPVHQKIGEDFVGICYAKTFETLEQGATSLLKTFNG